MRLLWQYQSLSKIVFILGESVLIFCTVALASFSLLLDEVALFADLKSAWSKVLLVVVVTQICLYFSDLYEEYSSGMFSRLGMRIVQSLGITSIALAFIYFWWPSAIIGRWVFLWSVIFLVVSLVSWRVMYASVIHKKLFTERTIILGNGELARDLFEEIAKKRESGYDVRFVVGEENSKDSAGRFNAVPLRYGFDKLYDLARAERITNIIVALDQRRGVMPYKELLNCKVSGVSVVDGESFYERSTGKILVDKINPSWLIFSEGFVKSPTSRIVKRVVGLVLSAMMVFLLSPLLIVVAIAIKFDSPGPVIFSQERVGENGKIFTLYKFRSMKRDAEKECGPVWASENDPRITRVGTVIRKLRIDELPQLWNVLRGDMSFVGPRPERPYFVDKLKRMVPYYDERFSVKPGVTGWAQIKYPYGASEKDAVEKLKFDLYYIKNMSIIMDLMVISHTVKIMLLGRGSR